MGKKNSSLTRVKPLGDEIIAKHALLGTLLSLVNANDIGDFKNDNVFYKGKEGVGKEKSLPPSPDHLLAIIKKIDSDEEFRDYIKKRVKSYTKGKKTLEKRIALCEKHSEKHSETMEQAIADIENKIPQTKPWWCKFEGDSQPDLFIENDKYIVLVEGKRTERSLTDYTSYLEHRSQMVRHIENTLYYIEENYGKNAKRVIAFYIVEKGCGYEDNCEKAYLEKYLNNELDVHETINKDGIKQAILDSFYGCTTWEAVSGDLRISFPD